jgi:membrane-associated phospholipid phosphatase
VPRLRSSEWLLVGYFTYVALAALIFGAGPGPWITLAAIAASILVFSLKENRVTESIRNIAPIFYTLGAYREMNWFTPSIRDHHLERGWIGWDRWLLDDCHLRGCIEAAGAMLPAYLELCYLLVYLVAPISIGLLFAFGRRARINRFWLAFLAGTLGAYGLFPYFPSEPPRIVYPGADSPHIETALRQLNLWIVGGYGIHSSVFPSAHVSLAFSAAWGLIATLPERPWIGRIMVLYACSVAIATVYGRYHYAVDAAAGIAISLLAIAALNLSKRYSV